MLRCNEPADTLTAATEKIVSGADLHELEVRMTFDLKLGADVARVDEHYRLLSRGKLSHSIKRAIDVIFSMFLLLLLAPVLACIVLLVCLDGGPALFVHQRIGFGGRSFGCLKFRTMVPGGEAVLRRTLETDPRAAQEWKLGRKLSSDPRVTAIGRLLRRSSMDELPQLLNVIKGEMSLVGPRPIVQEEVEFYGSDIAYYLQAVPGITGLWQVSGRSNTSYERRVELDVFYVKNWTMMLDFSILRSTIAVVTRGVGAR